MAKRTKTLLILGCGYVGGMLAHACLKAGMRVVGVTRSRSRAAGLNTAGIRAVVASGPEELTDDVLDGCQILVDSIPLERERGQVHAGQCRWLPHLAGRLRSLEWAGYLSATSVYGDAGGAWVDETTPCRPSSARGRERLRAERAWLQSGLPVEVFRLAGIYGPGRNIVARLRNGGYKVIRWQPPHWSSRIHVEDIVAALMAAMRHPRPGRIVNLADDLPLPHIDYVQEVAKMAGAPAPIVLSPEEGCLHLSPAQMAFFSESKRVGNRLLHRELLPQLKYPTFREGIAALL